MKQVFADRRPLAGERRRLRGFILCAHHVHLRVEPCRPYVRPCWPAWPWPMQISDGMTQATAYAESNATATH